MCIGIENYKDLGSITAVPEGDAQYLNQNQRRDEED